MTALPFVMPDLDTHPDGTLLRAIGRLAAIYREGDRAKVRSTQAYHRWVRNDCQEAVRLADLIADTRAETPEGILAKIELALRDLDPVEPSFHGLHGVAFSVLWDLLRSGRLG